ncbi:hypothetical protein [Deinococcus aetherius]|uniref:hypothetical protein n=1 Tax=Deinococcus aetherius TaxID=200252 RepID=UPI0022313AB5|nr:hypothetical protein [Deinococcus aetherius]
MRYIITRPCLQEGSLRLLKYLQHTFADNGPAQFVDDRGTEHTVQVDRAQGRVWGLGRLYHDLNLGVNDVLTLTPLAPGRYQVEATVKPHAAPPPPARTAPKAPEPRRVVVSATPHVREVRLEQPRPGAREATPAEPGVTVRPTSGPGAENTAPGVTAQAPLVPVQPAAPVQPLPEGPAQAMSTPRPRTGQRPEVNLSRPAPASVEGQLAELARLTGYRLDFPAPALARLRADLGSHGYTVHVALSEAATRSPAWGQGADHAALVTGEDERPQGLPRLTREALGALIEHARLAPLSPIDLRGYWKAGNLDLETAASVSELVGAHLAQRGAFSFVLLTLASHPAHSVVSSARLAEKLGSGVNTAELSSILDTLTRAPFLALTPLPGGEFLLRADVRDLLAELAEYAEGVRRRVRTPNAAPQTVRGGEPLAVTA